MTDDDDTLKEEKAAAVAKGNGPHYRYSAIHSQEMAVRMALSSDDESDEELLGEEKDAKQSVTEDLNDDAKPEANATNAGKSTIKSTARRGRPSRPYFSRNSMRTRAPALGTGSPTGTSSQAVSCTSQESATDGRDAKEQSKARNSSPYRSRSQASAVNLAFLDEERDKSGELSWPDEEDEPEGLAVNRKAETLEPQTEVQTQFNHPSDADIDTGSSSALPCVSRDPPLEPQIQPGAVRVGGRGATEYSQTSIIDIGSYATMISPDSNAARNVFNGNDNNYHDQEELLIEAHLVTPTEDEETGRNGTAELVVTANPMSNFRETEDLIKMQRRWVYFMVGLTVLISVIAAVVVGSFVLGGNSSSNNSNNIDIGDNKTSPGGAGLDSNDSTIHSFSPSHSTSWVPYSNLSGVPSNSTLIGNASSLQSAGFSPSAAPSISFSLNNTTAPTTEVPTAVLSDVPSSAYGTTNPTTNPTFGSGAPYHYYGTTNPSLASEAPYQYPTSFPSSANSVSLPNTEVPAQVLPNATLQALEDPDSAQSKAYDWFTTHFEDMPTEGYDFVERFALATLYYATDGPLSWVGRENWVWTWNICYWHSTASRELTICPIDGPEWEERFEILSLKDNGLNGTIPPEIGLLQTLKHTDFSGNNIRGTLPSQLGELKALEKLALGSNPALEGSIPTELFMLDSLTSLDLIQNLLTGGIPSEILQLRSIQWISIVSTTLGGTLPTEMGLLPQLQSVQLNGNALVGPIPSELGLLTSLNDILSVSPNELTGTLPTELGRLSGLRDFSFRSNILIGAIPSEFGLMGLTYGLYLYDNILSSSIPSELGQIVAMKHLMIHTNKLTGIIPSELGRLLALQRLTLDNNNLQGPIPSELGLLTALTELRLNNNVLLSGRVPAEVCALMLQEFAIDCSQVECCETFRQSRTSTITKKEEKAPAKTGFLVDLPWHELPQFDFETNPPSDAGGALR